MEGVGGRKAGAPAVPAPARKESVVAYIRTVPEPGTPPVDAIYKRVANPAGQVADVVKVFSAKPDLMRLFLEFSFGSTFGSTSLGRRREEMLSSYVSYLNRCFY